MDFPFGEQITVVTRTQSGRDSDGNTTYTETSTTVTGAFAPGGSSELIQGQDTVITQPTVYLPSGTVVAATDRVEVSGVRYLVDGQPNSWRNPFTGTDFGVEVRLQEVTG